MATRKAFVKTYPNWVATLPESGHSRLQDKLRLKPELHSSQSKRPVFFFLGFGCFRFNVN